jgi:hypothetical protein
LFEADVDTYAKPDGVGEPPATDPLKGVKDTRFKTPLWYYILKEAEIFENGERLGSAGEPAGGGGDLRRDFLRERDTVRLGWKSKITKSDVVMLRDLIDFVDEEAPVQVASVEDVQG